MYMQFDVVVSISYSFIKKKNWMRICVHSGFLLERKFFLSLHLPKFFMQLLVHPVNVLCLSMPEMQVSHICIQRAENSICYLVWRSFSGVGWERQCHILLAIISILITRHYLHFFQFWLDQILFCGLRGRSGVSHLPTSRLSFYVFFF